MPKSLVHFVQFGKMENGNLYASMLSSSIKFTIKDTSAGYRSNKIQIDTSNDNALARRLQTDLVKAGRPVVIDAELEQVDSKEIAKYILIDYELLSSSTEIFPSVSPLKDKAKEQSTVK